MMMVAQSTNDWRGVVTGFWIYFKDGSVVCVKDWICAMRKIEESRITLRFLA